MGMLSNDIVIHLEHVVLQRMPLKVYSDHAGRFLAQLVAEMSIRRFLALPGRRADSCFEGSLRQMGAECGHQRLTAIVKGCQLRSEELQYVVVSLAGKRALTFGAPSARSCKPIA